MLIKTLITLLPALMATTVLWGNEESSMTRVNSSDRNLLTNGSFELGLGAEPFYPGWRIAKNNLAETEVPALPMLDKENAHSGKQSLKLSRGRGKSVIYIDFQSPDMPADTVTHFSFWAKASRPGVKLLFGVCPEDGRGRLPTAPRLGHGNLASEWQLWQGAVPARAGVVPVRIEFSSDSAEPFEIWIDDISWTEGQAPASADARVRAGAVEVVLLPPARNAMRFAGEPVTFSWSADADANRDVALNLTLRDLTRGGEAVSLWRGKASLSAMPSLGEIVLPELKRGAWWAELEVSDSQSGELLGVGRERFTVMTDLRGVPAPVDFDAGYHGGLEFGNELGFNWRGYWTLDDFFANQFQTGFRVQRDIFDWEDLEPERGRYNWGYLDARVEAAHRNGCTTIICTPHQPFNLRRDQAEKVLNNPDSGDGRWIYQTGTDISKHSVRSTPMGGGRDPEQRNQLFAPDPVALTDFMTALVVRYHDKIDAIEFLNEPNLYVDPAGLLEYYFKPAYAAMKVAAPDLPVLMNQTMDFSADGNGYTGQFLKLGGFDYSDGVFHHPYGVAQLEDNGLDAIKTLERLAEIYSTPEKPLLLGMSEIHGLGGSSRAFIRGEVVQRALLDWAGGNRWSAGALLTRQDFYEGDGPRLWFMRGAAAPGVGAVHMNGLYSALGGYRLLRRVELDDNVLIMVFEKADSAMAGPQYAAAITAAEFPLVVTTLEADLEGIELEAFDFTGEPEALSSAKHIRLGKNALYLKSNDKALFDRLEAGRIAWGQAIAGVTEELLGPDAERSVYTTGVPPLREQKSGVITRWTLLDGVGAEGAQGADFPVNAGLTTASGELIWPKEQTRVVDHPLPYVFLSGDNPQTLTWHRAFTTIDSPLSGEMTWYFSATGPATLWLNGTDRIDLSDLPYGLVGGTWRELTIPVQTGNNHILLEVASRGAPAAFALSADAQATNSFPVAVDEDGYIRKWKMIGPWQNWRNLEGKYRGNAHAFPPELQLDFHMQTAGLRRMPLIWHEATYDSPVIPHPWVDGVSYAYTIVEVAEETVCNISLGSDDGYVIWVNGKLVGRNAASRGFKADVEQLPVVLKKGRNQILFKIDDTGGAGAFALRFLGDDGAPVDLTVVD